MPHKKKNSTTMGVAKPNVNLRPLLIERRARLIAKTVFLLEVLWNERSKLCRCWKASNDILRMPFWMNVTT